MTQATKEARSAERGTRSKALPKAEAREFIALARRVVLVREQIERTADDLEFLSADIAGRLKALLADPKTPASVIALAADAFERQQDALRGRRHPVTLGHSLLKLKRCKKSDRGTAGCVLLAGHKGPCLSVAIYADTTFRRTKGKLRSRCRKSDRKGLGCQRGAGHAGRCRVRPLFDPFAFLKEAVRHDQ